ncbi:MAG: phosphatidate cytidylyltransferase, partial [Anaerolineales bacterium]
MFRERAAVALLILPVFFWIIAQGGGPYLAAVVLALGLAAREYVALFRRHGYRPAGPLVILGVAALAAGRFYTQFESAPATLAAACLGCLTWHLVDYERGAARSGTDFAISLAGIVYLGWIGAFLISLRQLPQGEWWLLTALPAVWIADSAAYLVGKAVGR